MSKVTVGLGRITGASVDFVRAWVGQSTDARTFVHPGRLTASDEFCLRGQSDECGTIQKSHGEKSGLALAARGDT